MAFVDSYQRIESYEKFKELIDKRGLSLLQEKEPGYCTRVRTCKTLGLSYREILAECSPLLSGRFNRFIDLIESISEVGCYWKRLTETIRLIEVSVPVTSPYQMEQSSWIIYNLDFYWHTSYGLFERLIKFLKIFKRMYKSPEPEEAHIIDTHIYTFNNLKLKAGELIRNPLVHQRSQGVQGLRNEHEWEATLLIEGNCDFTKIYDENYLKHKDFYVDYIRQWTSQYGESLSNSIDRLSTFSLERLGIK